MAGESGSPRGSRYLQVGVLHQLELLLDDVELLLLRLDVSLQYASPLLQLLLQLVHHPQLGGEMVHWLQRTDKKDHRVGPVLLLTFIAMLDSEK